MELSDLLHEQEKEIRELAERLSSPFANTAKLCSEFLMVLARHNRELKAYECNTRINLAHLDLDRYYKVELVDKMRVLVSYSPDVLMEKLAQGVKT